MKIDDKLIETVTEEVLKTIHDENSCKLFHTERQNKADQGATKSRSNAGMQSSDALYTANARAVVTSTGMNKSGIAARITTTIFECGCDIVDISQTIVSDFFTMIIVVNTTGLKDKGLTFREFKAKIEDVSKDLGIETMVIHEDILKAMHRP